MGLVKRGVSVAEERRPSASLSEAQERFFAAVDNEHERLLALEEAVHFEGGATWLVELLRRPEIDHQLVSQIAALLSNLDPKKAPIDEILELLALENAFVRNQAITILRNYGDELRYYIVKYLISPDSDLRILAINILGDVEFPESREMLVELLASERDLNVAMTAVDYLAEIGTPEDIPTLEALRGRFNDEYAQFAITRAIEAIRGSGA
ncbi:MAG: HEAT repeat domain-containing protein [Campylobacterales bacterium]